MTQFETEGQGRASPTQGRNWLEELLEALVKSFNQYSHHTTHFADHELLISVTLLIICL